MNGPHGLSPFGTALEQFSRDRGDASADPMGPFLQQLASSLPLFAMEEEVAQIAQEVVAWQDGLTVRQRQALLLAVLGMMIAVQQGSTRVPLGAEEGRRYLLGIFGTLLGSGGPEGALTAAEALDQLEQIIASGAADAFLGNAGEFKPLIIADSCIAPYRMHSLEGRFIGAMKAILQGAAAGFAPDALDRALEEAAAGPFPLSEEQRTAVRRAVTSTFCIITGGPGTGKTSVVAAILRACLLLGVPPEAIALAAPTGKAANRMGASLGAAIRDVREPRTLHRLLGYSPAADRFRHHRGNPLSEQVVIVDEASMIDLFLMERLLGSLSEGTRLVLIGDADQLPSVEAGAVLRDLTASGAATSGPDALRRCTVRLTRSYRMDAGDEEGRSILSVARAVREAVPGGPLDRQVQDLLALRRSVEEIEFRKVELYDPRGDRRDLARFLERWQVFSEAGGGNFARLMRREYRSSREGFGPDDTRELQALFGLVTRCRILCLTTVYDTGTDAINRHFHAAFAKRAGRSAETEYLPGEPVMMQRNDYGRDLFNGDQGIVLRVADETGAQHYRAVFPRGTGFRVFPLDPLRASLRHAFAVTVHKSQGSEHDHVALILPDRPIPIVTKEILYTGISRSRRSVTIIGSRDLLTEGAGRGIVRFSGIAGGMAVP